MNLSVHYNVSTAQAMWDAARGARSYSVQAVTDQGWAVSCDANHTSCFLNGLQCSQIYNVTVTARNLVCNNTVTSEPYSLMTGLLPEVCKADGSVRYLNVHVFPSSRTLPSHQCSSQYGM